MYNECNAGENEDDELTQEDEVNPVKKLKLG